MAYLDRFKWWVTLFVSSIVLLASLYEQQIRRNDPRQETISVEEEQPSSSWTRQDISTALFPGISILLSFMGIMISFLPSQSTRIKRTEAVLIWTSMILWGVAAAFGNLLPTNAEESIETNVIAEPNIFFSAYLSLIASVLLLASWYQLEVQTDDSITTTKWILLCASSFIVMISAVGFRDRRLEISPQMANSSSATPETMVNETVYWGNDTAVVVDPSDARNPLYNFTTNTTGVDTNTTIRTSFCEASESFSCQRVDFAIVWGALSAAVSLAICLSKSNPFGCLVDVSLIMFIGWVCAVAFLTFNSGPGIALGSIFLATWISLLLSLDIFLITSAQKAAEEQQREVVAAENHDLVDAHTDLISPPSEDIRSVGQENFAIVDEMQEDLELRTLPFVENQISPTSAKDSSDETQRSSGSSFGHYDGQRPQRRHHILRPALTNSDRTLSESIFSSVGAWRETTIRDMQGNVIPDEVANPATVSSVDQNIEADEFSRVELWILLIIASIDNLVSALPIYREFGSRIPLEKASLAVPSSSIIISLVGCLSSKNDKPLSHVFEIVLIGLSIIIWIIGLVLRSYYGRFAERDVGTGTILNANTFLSFWAAFLISVVLACKWCQTKAFVAKWVLLGVFGSALFASSILFYVEELTIRGEEITIDGRACELLNFYSCSRVLFGQYLGLVTGLIALLILVIQNWFPQRIIKLVVGAALLIAWAFGVAYITYWPGHGRNAGSIYLETWCGFFLSLDIVCSNIVYLLQKMQDSGYLRESRSRHSTEADRTENRSHKNRQIAKRDNEDKERRTAVGSGLCPQGSTEEAATLPIIRED